MRNAGSVIPRADVAGLVGTAEGQGRRLQAPLAERGLLGGSKDAPLQVAFPLSETGRTFPNLWAPSALGTLVELDADIRAGLQLPLHVRRLRR